MSYRVVIPRKVQKDLNRLDEQHRKRITTALLLLSDNPYAGKRLEGKRKEEWSYKIWPYRIIYQIRHSELVILVIRIGHRQGIYK